MPNREDIVREAAEWEGTRWVHQQSLKGVAADCEGFLEGVASNCDVPVLVEVVRNYRRREDGSLMLRLLEEALDFVTGSELREPPDMSGVMLADVIAFCDEKLFEPNKPKHLGLLTRIRADGVLYVTHASERGVVKHRLSYEWLRRIHSVWRIRDLDG